MKFNLAKTSVLMAAMSLALAGCNNSDNDDAAPASTTTPASSAVPTTYKDFAVTLNPEAEGAADDTADQTTSVSYSGQMARHTLRENLKKLLGTPSLIGSADEATVLAKINDWLKNGEDSTNAVDDDTLSAPATKDSFIITQTMVSELSSGKSLYADAYAGSQVDPIPDVTDNFVMGVPGTEVTAQDVLDVWAANFARNYAANLNDDSFDMDNGFEYNQLFAKFLMGAVFYNKAVDKYLDEYLAEDTKPHNLPYKDGKHYTGKEHSWDEGFGYFGAAANYGELTAEQNYNVKKQKADYFANADWNEDGEVSLYTEYTSGPAYYAADADKNSSDDSPSTYGSDIMDAWLEGRQVIADAVDDDGYARVLTDSERDELMTHADTIRSNWEMVIAEAVYKYAGSSHSDIEDYQNAIANSETGEEELQDYYHHWSEGKGMMLSLQFGGANATMDKTNFLDIDGLLGFGPVLGDGSQVTGISGNTFTKTAATGTAEEALDAYQLKLKQVQQKLDALYSLNTKKNTID